MNGFGWEWKLQPAIRGFSLSHSLSRVLTFSLSRSLSLQNGSDEQISAQIMFELPNVYGSQSLFNTKNICILKWKERKKKVYRIFLWSSYFKWISFLLLLVVFHSPASNLYIDRCFFVNSHKSLKKIWSSSLMHKRRCCCCRCFSFHSFILWPL